MEWQVSAYLFVTYQYVSYLGSMMNEARSESDVKSNIVTAKSTVRKKKIVLHYIPTKTLNSSTSLCPHCTLLHVSARGLG
jgi:hypothetical protein